MRRLIIVLLVLIGGVLLGQLLVADAGFVVIGYHGYALRTSLAFFCLVLAVVVVGSYVLIRLLRNLLTARRSLHDWSRYRRAARAERALHRGLLSLAEGAWEDAEQDFTRSADRSEQPLLHYLGAARAADAMGATERRDTYLKLAHDSGPVAQTVVGLTRSEMEIARGNLPQAKETLVLLLEQDPRNRHALRLLCKSHLQSGEWHALLGLLPRLGRAGVLDRKEFSEIERKTYLGVLASAEARSSADAPDRWWRRMPRRYRREAAFIAVHCRNLQALERHAEAERLLRRHLQKHWNAELIALYSELHGADPLGQLQQLERWLGEHGTGTALLRAAGVVAYRNELWGKARSYLQEALNQDARPETYQLLAQTLERMGETQDAARISQRGLALAAGEQRTALQTQSTL